MCEASRRNQAGTGRGVTKPLSLVWKRSVTRHTRHSTHHKRNFGPKYAGHGQRPCAEAMNRGPGWRSPPWHAVSARQLMFAASASATSFPADGPVVSSSFHRHAQADAVVQPHGS
eukprot:7147685-Prymnesium_polylepis.1